MSGSISLRPVGDDDRELLYRIYAGTRADEMVAVPWTDTAREAFLRQQFEAQHRHYTRHYSNARFDMILRDGRSVGRLYVDRRADEIRVVDIALLPEYRGGGIGTALLEELVAEADEAGLVLRVHVARHNPAQRLYKRLGFGVIDESGVHLLLEKAPSNPEGR